VVASNLEARLAENIQSTELAMQASRMREAIRDDAVDGRLAALSAELNASVAVKWASMRSLWEQQFGQLRQDHEVLAGEFGTFRDSTRALTLEGFNQLQQQQVQTDKDQDAKLCHLESKMQETLNHFEQRFEAFRADGEQTMVANAEASRRDVDDIRQETASKLAWLIQQAGHTRELVKEVENIPTRRVEWLIRGASRRAASLMRGLRGETPGSRPSSGTPGAAELAVGSPIFETGGASGLRLELRPSEVAFDSEIGEGSCAGSGIGDCDLLLWCHHRLHIVCRLSVGNESVQVEHTFDGDRPCIARRLATLFDQICAEDDTLRVGVEVLEVVREVAGGSSGSAAGEERAEEASDSLTLYRYLNHRILDLVESKVEVMRSRMVRRIEWRIENASTLRQAFPEGECLCSTTFAAAGMEGMQLVFYPAGYAGAKEGYCSYYLYCPAGSALRCWLAIGKQRREARLFFERDGFYGRTNFCRFDFCVDASEDCIVLVLDIDEAQQKVTQTLAHEIAHEAPAAHETGSRSPVERLQIGSKLTLKRTPGSKALEDVRQLPCIWTSRPQANLAEALEGFHALTDIRARKPLNKDGAFSHRGGRAPHPAGMATPPVLDRYLMYAA